ncbi:Protein kinase domain and Serine/threonine-/dual specificity protein kinase, catalytic domain and Protein kinase-like domain-containing protein [Strongyloides ratti]|uniref:non-specific serine/threonine protein kinase n=1 Tax=Strongyloides ratti TaxID=34506 RepID=A0A090LAA3_STRRB|nr:Protein kinase domain and Serine/threonine-/dual specificity protein kinase, catalytic domain and Protein kinase-like domain-containing protein [Strongyloides ratti]CEF65073.1 Protein kinase domain and Serine/threonine-/dual specificity protein kinase, catalytic domain and Protein kinase-like domain-containing protein [Strongyloides ratti]
MSLPVLVQDDLENKVGDNMNNHKIVKTDYPGFNELLGRRIMGWTCEEIIGKGTFGVIYKCSKKATEENSKVTEKTEKNEKTEKSDKNEKKDKYNKIYAALKAEDQTKQDTHIIKEVRILEALNKKQSKRNFFADPLGYGEKRKFKFVITTLFGTNLFDILTKMPNQRIELRTWIRVVINILEGLKILHKIKIVHLDLKPANIIVDYQNKRKQNDIVVRIIDFGLSRHLKYKCNVDEIPINLEPSSPVTEKDGPIWFGSIFHCSPHLHRGCDPSYRDDVYSWLFVSMDLYIKLPWTPADTEINIAKKKINATCDFYKTYFPVELEPIVKNIVEAPSNKPPEYNKILEQLKAFMQKHSVLWSEPCQWEINHAKKESQIPNNNTLKKNELHVSNKKKIVDDNNIEINISEKGKNNKSNLKTDGCIK